MAGSNACNEETKAGGDIWAETCRRCRSEPCGVMEKCNLGREMISATGPGAAVCSVWSREMPENQCGWSCMCQREHLDHLETFGFYSKCDRIMLESFVSWPLLLLQWYPHPFVSHSSILRELGNRIIHSTNNIYILSPYHVPGTVLGFNLGPGNISSEHNRQTPHPCGAYIAVNGKMNLSSLLAEIHMEMREWLQCLPLFGFASWAGDGTSQKVLRDPLLSSHRCFVLVTLVEIKSKRLMSCWGRSMWSRGKVEPQVGKACGAELCEGAGIDLGNEYRPWEWI